MKLKADLFPYPVLNTAMDDYANNDAFSSRIEWEQLSLSKIKLSISFRLEDKEIQYLIESEKAVYAVHLEGISSSYRRLFLVPNKHEDIEITLSAEEVAGKIEVNFMILANNKILDYKNSNFNSDYFPDDYVVRRLDKGDIIAFDTMAELNIEYSNKENPGAKSMIRVAMWEEDFMNVDLEGDVIKVNLPEKSYNAYFKLSNSDKIKEKLLLVAIVLPSLTFTIEQIKSNPGDWSSRKWYEALENLLDKLGITMMELGERDSMEVAQKLLDMPLEKALDDFLQAEVGNDD